MNCTSLTLCIVRLNQTHLTIEEVNEMRDLFANKDVTVEQFKEFMKRCNEAKLWLQKVKVRIENMRILANCQHFGGP